MKTMEIFLYSIDGLCVIAFIGAMIYLKTQATECLTQMMAAWRARVVEISRPRLSRVDALDQLDELLSAQTHYALLQRLTIIAPLIGVVLTAAGFMSLGSISEIVDPWNMLSSFQPVFIGVVIGAVLSIVNQCVVVKFQSWLSETRNGVIEKIPPAAFNRAETPIEEIKDAIVESTEKLRIASHDLTEQTNKTAISNTMMMEVSEKAIAGLCQSCQAAAESFSNMNFVEELRDFNQSAKKMAEAIDTASTQLDNQTDVSYKKVAAIIESFTKRASDLTSTIETSFVQHAGAVSEALVPLSSVTEQLSAFAASAGDYATQLKSGEKTFTMQSESAASQRDSAERLNEASKNIFDSFANIEQKAIVPMAEGFTKLNDATDRLVSSLNSTGTENKSSSDVLKGIKYLAKQTQVTFESLDQTIAKLEGAIENNIKAVSEMNEKAEQILKKKKGWFG